MASGHTHTTPTVRAFEGPNFRAVCIDTSSEEGRAFMRELATERRRREAMAFPLMLVREALASHRKTQANALTGWPGYFRTPADSRAFVREALAAAREAARAHEAKEAANGRR